MFRWTFGGGILLLLVFALGQPACTRPDTGGAAPPAAETPRAAETPMVAETSPPVAETSPEETPSMDTTQNYRGLKPFPGVKAPAITDVKTVRFQTDEGDLLIEIYPQAAPNAAKQFLELVKIGFYDETPVFRIVPGFVAQFGINWRGDFPKWKNKNFNDDPSLFLLEPGTLAFAKAGPNTNSTQVFINYGDNSQLKDNGNFTTFGKVVEGFDNAKKFKRVGDPSMGLDQQQLWTNGGAYLESQREKPTMIRKAEIVEKG